MLAQFKHSYTKIISLSLLSLLLSCHMVVDKCANISSSSSLLMYDLSIIQWKNKYFCGREYTGDPLCLHMLSGESVMEATVNGCGSDPPGQGVQWYKYKQDAVAFLPQKNHFYP